jgi:hypothetical protein
MKIEKWTLGLAAIGLVTLAPALLAQSGAVPQLVPVQTALTATTISGYVDTSAVWNPGTGNANPAPYGLNAGKQDGFNLNAVDIKIAKAADEGKWSAGYVAELSYGPDAQAIDGGAYPLRQAYVDLKMPVGNDLDWRIGRWDSLLGKESSDTMNNANYTFSYGKTFEPTENTGLLLSYSPVADVVKLQAGVADTLTTTGYKSSTVNDRVTLPGENPTESRKALVSLLTLTAPDSWGGFKGSSLYIGWDYGQGAETHNKSEVYVGSTILTPVKDLTFGATWDSIYHNDVAGLDASYFQSIAGYVSYKPTDKLKLSGRAEYADGLGLGAEADQVNGGGYAGGEPVNPLREVLAFTGTVQYDLWDNVITRLEARWDHAASGGDAFGGVGAPGTVAPDKRNEVMLGANVIYKF